MSCPRNNLKSSSMICTEVLWMPKPRSALPAIAHDRCVKCMVGCMIRPCCKVIDPQLKLPLGLFACEALRGAVQKSWTDICRNEQLLLTTSCFHTLPHQRSRKCHVRVQHIHPECCTQDQKKKMPESGTCYGGCWPNILTVAKPMGRTAFDELTHRQPPGLLVCEAPSLKLSCHAICQGLSMYKNHR